MRATKNERENERGRERCRQRESGGLSLAGKAVYVE